MMSSSLDTNNTKATKPKFWLVVQEQAKKAKLQTEMAWLKRQIGSRQKKLGVELFTILNGGSGSDNNAKQTLLGNDAEAAAAAPLFADSSEPSWFPAFEKCQEELRPLLHQHEALEHECQGLLHRIEEATTPRDKLQLIAKRKQFQAKLLVMEQQIQRRQESFGVSIFDTLSTSTTLSTSDNVNGTEQKVIDCIQAALADVRHLQARINAKYSRAHDLHHGETEGLMAGNHDDLEETTAPIIPSTPTTTLEGDVNEDSDEFETEDL